ERLTFRDEVLDRLKALVSRLDDDAALVLVVAAEADRAIDLGDDGMVLRTASLEQFRNTRQTTGDVLGLGALEGNTRQNVAGRNAGAGFHGNDRIDAEQVTGIRATLGLEGLPLRTDRDGGAQPVTALAGTPVDDQTLGEARGF